jgi:mitochondrial intermediate peptidase
MLRSSCRQFRFIHPSRLHISRSLSPHRHLGTSTASTSAPHLAFGVLSPQTNPEDQTLRKVFDSQQFWSSFSRQASQNGWGSIPNGLFQNKYLAKPSGFHDFTQVTLQKCRRIVDRILSTSGAEGYKSLPNDLDRLSDTLCRLLDLAEFVRFTHPDSSFQQAANQAYVELFEYMNVLNTTTSLNTLLRKALANPNISDKWGEEQKIVAQIMLRDFSKSAIDLPQEQRKKFVSLSSEISQLGTTFLRDMNRAKSVLGFSPGRLKGMDPSILGQITNFRGKVSLPVTGPFTFTALRTVEDEAVRREVYVASRTAADRQIRILQDILKSRAEIARLSGYQSYAEMILSDKMAQSPDAVNSFLEGLSTANALPMRQVLMEMWGLKKQSSNVSDSSVEINAWDKEYYQARLAIQTRSKARRPDFVSAYFSLGRVMQGLSRLFKQLYGVRFVAYEPRPGETWNSDVRRLDVMDEKEGHIAVIYCDLFARQGKSPNPAHFTLRCSRLISPEELEEASAISPGIDPAVAANDGMAFSRTPSGAVYQLPIIALICDFEQPEAGAEHPTLLTFRDVQTLFHEMGHAIHSILGRTKLQVVAGVRCATDFVELPSVLMEHFASDPTVLSLFAYHWESSAPLPYVMIAEKLALDRRRECIETETQVLLAMLDQTYHSNLPDSFDTTRILHDIYDRYGSFREPGETTAQGFFGHLIEYGGTYYSYLFDRAIAGKVWNEVFQGGRDGGAVSREKGQRFRDEVLRWGGARSGWSCLAGLLGDERLKDGGPEAMAEVGRWGVENGTVGKRG